ncbi:MAG: acylphosphatase [Ignisphaera sp.]
MSSYFILVKGVIRGFGLKGFIYEKMRIRKLRGFIEDIDSDEILVCIENADHMNINEIVNEIKNEMPYVIISDIDVFPVDSCNPRYSDIDIIEKDYG